MKNRFHASGVAPWIAGTAFCAAVVVFAGITAKKVDENRAGLAAQFQSYGTPIQVETNFDFGEPVEVTLTSSSLEYSQWAGIQSLLSESLEASGDVISEVFQTD